MIDTRAKRTLAPTASFDDINTEGRAISAYLETPHAARHLRTPAQREALFHLAHAPFTTSSIEELCRRMAEALQALDGSDDEVKHWEFERALADCRDGDESAADNDA